MTSRCMSFPAFNQQYSSIYSQRRLKTCAIDADKGLMMHDFGHGGPMAKGALDRQSRLAHAASASACMLSGSPVRYLQTVRKLLAQYQRAGAVQQQIFVTMMHAFMQELCGYPLTGYVVTSAAYSPTAVGSSPHVVPTACAADLTLFYFTISEQLDDVHDLWVKHAQVYLATYNKGDSAAEGA